MRLIEERDAARAQVRQLREEIVKVRDDYACAPAFKGVARMLTAILEATK